MRRPDQWLSSQLETAAVSAVQKYVSFSTAENALHVQEPQPPYKREFNPRWIYNIRKNHSLINNAIEEKVSQTFRRGFDEWEKKYEAKCPNCKEEFGDETPFRQQYESIPEDEEIDFGSERVCPECDEKVEMKTPDPNDREMAEQFFQQVNERNTGDANLQPEPESGIGQSAIQLFKEIGWDIESFDDGWMLFDRSYRMTEDGEILDYSLEGIYRGPPDKMSISYDKETGRFGGEYWACLLCRGQDENYTPEVEDKECSQCGGETYEVYAYSTAEPTSETPESFFIRGEFVHESEYEPSRYYGYSPVVTLFDEARSLEKMDEWYREAYKQRRAPRGALIIRSSNADATQKWNRGQLEKLNNDANHIPTLMDDSEGGGGADPIKFVELLPTPAEMQQMEMRDWIKERISAKYGVTEIMMSGSPDNSGLSQSMEVQVSARAADRLRSIFNQVFIPAIIGQLGVEGWEVDIAEIEQQDEVREAERAQRHLQIAQQASQLGLEVEWKDDNTASVKPGEVEMDDEGMGGMFGGDMGGDMGGGDEVIGTAPGPGEDQPQLDGVGDEEGEPDTDSRPAEDEPAFGRMAKDLRDGDSIEVYNEWTGEWEKAELKSATPHEVKAETESGVEFVVTDSGEVRAA